MGGEGEEIPNLSLFFPSMALVARLFVCVSLSFLTLLGSLTGFPIGFASWLFSAFFLFLFSPSPGAPVDVP